MDNGQMWATHSDRHIPDNSNNSLVPTEQKDLQVLEMAEQEITEYAYMISGTNLETGRALLMPFSHASVYETYDY